MESSDLALALGRGSPVLIDREGDLEWHAGGTDARQATSAIRRKVVTRDDRRRRNKKLDRTVYIAELWDINACDVIVLVEGPPAPRILPDSSEYEELVSRASPT